MINFSVRKKWLYQNVSEEPEIIQLLRCNYLNHWNIWWFSCRFSRKLKRKQELICVSIYLSGGFQFWCPEKWFLWTLMTQVLIKLQKVKVNRKTLEHLFYKYLNITNTWKKLKAHRLTMIFLKTVLEMYFEWTH